MKTNSLRIGLGAFALGSLAVVASAQALYATSGSNGVNGRLYKLDPATGAMLQDVGPLQNAAGAPFGVTGLAFIGGTLYGSTANASPTGPGTLVTINTTTGMVTSIGTFFTNGGTMSDLTSHNGILYGWRSNADHSMYTVNTGTGASTIIGAGSGNPGFGGGALAADGSGNFFASPNGTVANSGWTLKSFYSVNPATGALTSLGVHSGLNGVINSMTFAGSTLYGIMANQGAPSLTQLVTINPANGAVTTIGPSIDNLDGLAYDPVPEPATLIALGVGALALARRRRKTA